MGVEVETIEAADVEIYPCTGDRLIVNYVGWRAAGGRQTGEFDSSYSATGTTKGKPLKFNIGIDCTRFTCCNSLPKVADFCCSSGAGEVIRGWDEGLLQMALGSKALLTISADFGYGEHGAGDGAIPPGADLNFEVHLLAINDKRSKSLVALEEEQEAQRLAKLKEAEDSWDLPPGLVGGGSSKQVGDSSTDTTGKKKKNKKKKKKK
jgi:FK506-binding protein 1